MKNYSNTYIFLYASALVIVVALLLSSTATILKPLQKANIENKKRQDILSSVNIECNTDNAAELYSKYISDSYVLNIKGEKVEGDAFNTNLKKELVKKDKNDMRLPIFECILDDGRKNYIVPLQGKGLGGDIWGYIALKKDMNTVIGTTFDHIAETPGLGDKITLLEFRSRFENKKIFNKSGTFQSIGLIKGKDTSNDPHKIDAISGATITSNGVDAMLHDCLINYETYFKNKGE